MDGTMKWNNMNVWIDEMERYTNMQQYVWILIFTNMDGTMKWNDIRMRMQQYVWILICTNMDG